MMSKSFDLGGRKHGLQLDRVGGDRLLAQHVLPGVQARDRLDDPEKGSGGQRRQKGRAAEGGGRGVRPSGV